jgi:L-fuconolactonase
MARNGTHLQIGLMTEKMRIDSHQHFWEYNAQEYSWIDDNMAVLRRDFLPENLKAELEPVNLHGSIAVQARQTIDETRWLLELAENNPVVLGVIGWVDLRSPNLAAQLDEFCNHPKFVGVRHVVQDEPDDRFLLKPDFIAGLKEVEARKLVYDLLVFPKQLPAAIELVAQFPNMRFVLDHIAKPAIKEQKLQLWQDDISILAGFPNVYCKVSGMVTEADWQNWKQEDFKPYLDIIFKAFGPERLMFGSDWPVCTMAGKYKQVFGLVDNYLAEQSPEVKEAIFGENARKVYLSKF